jgi:5-methylcytosine-specific restriction protein A
VAERNPPWSRDELILALDLYFQHKPTTISKTHPKVVELSKVLDELPIHQDRPDRPRFRNPNGVYMKMCNFLALDPTYGGKGLERGGRLEQEI